MNWKKVGMNINEEDRRNLKRVLNNIFKNKNLSTEEILAYVIDEVMESFHFENLERRDNNE